MDGKVADFPCYGDRNWSSALFFGVLVIAAMYYWAVARHIYTGPVMLVNRDR